MIDAIRFTRGAIFTPANMLSLALQVAAIPRGRDLHTSLLLDSPADSAEGSVYADDQQTQAYSTYLHAFNECAPAPWVDLNGTSAADYGRILNPPLHNLEHPHVPLSACVGGAWTITRAGPVTTSGNTRDWMSFVVNPTEVQPPNSWAVDAYLVGRADERGELIPYPPLLLYDRHLGLAMSVPLEFREAAGSAPDNKPISVWADAVLDNHYDSQCSSARGGTACLAHVAPPGFGWFFSGHLALYAHTFDMRPNHSQPLSSWETVALRVTQASRRPVHRELILHSLVFVLPVMRGNESVLWNSGTSALPSASLLGTPSWHSHGKDVTEAWLFQGTAATVFEELAAVLPAFQKPWYGAAAVATVRDSIRARTALAGASPLVCSYLAEDLYPNTESTSLGTVWRHTPCPLLPPLREWVMVIFVNPPATLPAETCPSGARGCSPVLVEPSSTEVILHTFVRVNLGVTGDDALAATGMAEYCTPGTSCRPSFLGYAPAASCTNHSADCTYPECDGKRWESCAMCDASGCNMPDLTGTGQPFREDVLEEVLHR